MMKLSYYQIKDLPLIIIDDFYEAWSYEKIWEEICFLNNDHRKFKSPEELDSAFSIHDDKKIYLKKNRGIIVDQVYKDRNISNILTENRKLFDKTLVDKLIEYHIFFRYFNTSNYDLTKLHYYENLDYYDTHLDQSIITAVTYFYRDPKSFKGGELIIEKEIEIECIKNRMIIFPSILSHAVNPVFVDEDLIGSGVGRYSVTQFVGIR